MSHSNLGLVKIRCPKCGCATVNALPSKAFNSPEGNTIMMFRCRRCANLFNEVESQNFVKQMEEVEKQKEEEKEKKNIPRDSPLPNDPIERMEFIKKLYEKKQVTS